MLAPDVPGQQSLRHSDPVESCQPPLRNVANIQNLTAATVKATRVEGSFISAACDAASEPTKLPSASKIVFENDPASHDEVEPLPLTAKDHQILERIAVDHQKIGK